VRERHLFADDHRRGDGSRRQVRGKRRRRQHERRHQDDEGLHDGKVYRGARPRYNAGMSLKNVDIESTLRRLAERRIEDAMKEGKFDNLAGGGAPLELEPVPVDENARMTWWALKILKQNDVMPDEVKWRKALDDLKHRLERLHDESRLESLATQINDLVRRINTMGTNAINIAATGVSLEDERERLRLRVAEVNA
jgi:hypothetical protein